MVIMEPWTDRPLDYLVLGVIKAELSPTERIFFSGLTRAFTSIRIKKQRFALEIFEAKDDSGQRYFDMFVRSRTGQEIAKYRVIESSLPSMMNSLFDYMLGDRLHMVAIKIRSADANPQLLLKQLLEAVADRDQIDVRWFILDCGDGCHSLEECLPEWIEKCAGKLQYLALKQDATGTNESTAALLTAIGHCMQLRSLIIHYSPLDAMEGVMAVLGDAQLPRLHSFRAVHHYSQTDEQLISTPILRSLILHKYWLPLATQQSFKPILGRMSGFGLLSVTLPVPADEIASIRQVLSAMSAPIHFSIREHRPPDQQVVMPAMYSNLMPLMKEKCIDFKLIIQRPVPTVPEFRDHHSALLPAECFVGLHKIELGANRLVFSYKNDSRMIVEQEMAPAAQQ